MAAERWLRLRAFGERIFASRVPAPGEDLSLRAAKFLEHLAGDALTDSQRIALLQLERQSDLWTNDEAVRRHPEVLQLMVRLVSLAVHEPIAQRILDARRRAPMSKLFAAIVTQAFDIGATEIQINFVARTISGASTIRVSYLGLGGWKEGMTVPASLDDALRGMTRLVEAAGFESARTSLLPAEDKLPDDLTMTWLSPEIVNLRISS